MTVCLLFYFMITRRPTAAPRPQVWSVERAVEVVNPWRCLFQQSDYLDNGTGPRNLSPSGKLRGPGAIWETIRRTQSVLETRGKRGVC